MTTYFATRLQTNSVIGPEVTTHEIRQRAKCKRCGTIGALLHRSQRG